MANMFLTVLKKALRERYLRFATPNIPPPVPYGFGLDTPNPCEEYWIIPPPPRGRKWSVWRRLAESSIEDPEGEDWWFDAFLSQRLTQIMRNV
jgi:hypothetical protein